MRRPLVSIIIVVYNNLNDLEGCLSSVLKSGYPNVEIIAVDSASTDGSPDLIRKEFPSVKLMEYPINVGFGEANNRAFRLSKGEYIFLLNPDTQIPKDTISILVDRMERDPQIGILAPKMLFLQEPKVINSAGIQSNRIFYSCDRGFLEYDCGQYAEETDVISACGGAMFIRRSVIDEIGLFDSQYFMYYEDTDLGIRSWLAGYKVLYVPNAIVYHRMQASGRSEYLNEYLDHKNRIRTILKNCSLAVLIKVMFRNLIFDLGCAANHLLVKKYNAAKLRLRALLWNLVMLPDTLSQRSRINKSRKEPDSVFLRLLGAGYGYPKINAPLPSYSPAYASTLDPDGLQPRIEPGRPDAKQLGLGWYGPEKWVETPIRWTSKYGIAFLKKPWAGRGYLTVQYISPLDSSGRVLINDSHLCHFSGAAGKWETIREEIDADPGIVKVTLLLDKTFVPKRDLGAQDSRILGIAVSHIALTKTDVEPIELVSIVLNADLKKAAEVGAQQALASQNLELYQKLYWMEHPWISGPYINQQISGDPETNWLAWVKRAFVPNVLDYGLSLGCGSGALERHAIRLGICKRFDAFDISKQAIEMAIQYAAMEGISGIRYEVRDINKIELPESRYDIALISSALHHVKELEHVLTQIDKSLKPGGLLAFSEFVGPSQFQWTDKQLRMINNLLALLPRKYRADIRNPPRIKERVDRPSIEYMNEADPSEAIRSAEIIPLVERYFEVIQRVDFGGTLLHMLLSDIVGNFNPDIEEDVAIIRLLCYFEKTLIKEGVLPSDFTVIVAKKRRY